MANIVIDSAEYFYFDLDVKFLLNEDSNGDPLSYTRENLYDSAAFEFSQVEYFHIEKQTDKIKKTAYGEASQKETWG